jgi:broad specificity phosphatase PhoE
VKMRSNVGVGQFVHQGHQREHAMIYLLRHGQTEFNLEGRYQGQADSPLTDRGRAQARAYGTLLAEHVGAASIWTSPLQRAVETARLMAKALPEAELHIDDRLREVSFGVWEGMTRTDIAAGWPNVRRQHPPRQWKLFAPGGEGIEPLLSRLGAVLGDAAALKRDLILVGHGVAGRLIRGLHVGLSLTDALALDASQDVVYRLHGDGQVDHLLCAPH